MCHPFCLLLLILGLAPALLLGQVDSTAAGRVSQGNLVRPLTVYQTRYRLRAGESTKVDVAPETLDFLLHAKTRHVEIAGKDERGIVVGPNRARDQILVAVSLAMKPGEYTLALSATTEAGERRDATLSITVDALTLVPANATQPPVILLNGWQGSTCSPSPASETFGNLADYLTENDGVPVVYWFDNCTVCPTCLIETLGSDLAQAIGSIKYDNGAPVLQVDLIAHSMGGLIVRSYLSGKQIPQGVFNPPNNPNVRKAIFIATPHLGSYQAGVANDLFLGNPQTDEMALGSQFLFDLATWNQFGDDLRGTDALAIVGDAVLGSKGDGIVSSTSASLRFAEPDVRTRIVDYCHMTFSLAEAVLTGCYDPGIAFIDSASHPTFQIVQSFLANTTAWETIGTSPSQDPYLSVSGGLLLASKNAGNQYYADLSSISAANASLTLKAGPSNSVASLFYNEWVPANTYDLAVWSGANETLAGALTATAGGGIATFFKQGPVIFSVRSLAISSLPGRIVQSGGTITISGLGFGQQCSGCQVLAVPPGSATGYLLPVSSWTNQAISASFLPATMPSLTIPGLVTIYVELSSSAWDSINIMAAAPASTIVVAPTSLRFSYTEGGTVPAAQSIQLTNNGGGALNWSATTSASWLSVAPASGIAPSTPSVLVSPAGLSAGTYTGSVQVSAAGASNSSVSVTVTLTVAPASAVLAVSPQTLMFNYAMGSATPAAQGVSINNGGGTLAWTASSSASWLTVSPAYGSTSSTLSVSMNPLGLIAGALNGTITISSPGIASQTLSVTLTVTSAPLTPAIVSVVNAASFLPGFAPIGWVTITGKNLSATSRTWTGSDIVNGQLPTALDGVSVTINNHPAFVYYISPGQLNVQAPSDSLAADQNVQVTVTTPNGSATATALERHIAPAMFMSDSTHVAAIHSDGTLVGPVGFIPGAASRPASPGETILLYMTGLGGDTSPVIPAGQIVTSPASMTDPVSVSIGGQSAIVQYAGLVSPGLYQLNVVVPAVANGDQTATVQVAGVASENTGVVTVQQ